MRLYKDIDNYPRLTPIFGVCKTCGCQLPYPPVQIPVSVQPAQVPLRWVINWERYCLGCAAQAIQNVKAGELVPRDAWDPESPKPVPNPFHKE
jgi:hypothetical protein